MLQALAHLSDVGVRVIQASKAATIDSLQQLAPGADPARRAGDDFVKALQRLPDLPVRRRGRRSRPAGRPQPAHGRLHQPVGQARPRPCRTRCRPGCPPTCIPTLPTRRSRRRSASNAADHPADDPRPDGDPRRRAPACKAAAWPARSARRCWPRRSSCSSSARSAPSRRTRTRPSASSCQLHRAAHLPTACRSRLPAVADPAAEPAHRRRGRPPAARLRARASGSTSASTGRRWAS